MYYMIMNIICRTDSKELELQTINIDKLSKIDNTGNLA